MSQTKIRSGLHNNDWMRELETDAQQMQCLVSRMAELTEKALFDLGKKDNVAAGIRLLEIKEGLMLLCQLTGIKVNFQA